MYYSNSITSHFIEYPYAMSPALLIGDYLGARSYAINSFLPTGFMRAGFFGMILYAFLFGLLLRLIESVARYGVPVWMAVATMIIPSHALLTSADLPTALLTHGIGISSLLLFLLRSAHKK